MSRQSQKVLYWLTGHQICTNFYCYLKLKIRQRRFPSALAPMGLEYKQTAGLLTVNSPRVNGCTVWLATADVVPQQLVGESCPVYMDDIIVYSPYFESYLQDIERVLCRPWGARLELKPSKCQFMKSDVNYSCYVVSTDKVGPDPRNERVTQECPCSSKKIEVRALL